jgi:hypothetical protein
MVYYVIALALYMSASTREVLRCLLKGLRWLWGAEAVRVAGKGGISQARTRLGAEPLRRLHDQLVRPVATRTTRGAWYRRWRLVSLDGFCLDVVDSAANRQAFGLPGASRGASAFPQLRFVALVENGTHVLFGTYPGRYEDGETTLARPVLAALQPGMLCLADRPFFGHALWQEAAATGADLLWRVKRNLRLPREAVLADGSYPDDDLSQREGSAASGQRLPAAGDRVPVGRRRRGRAALPAGDDDPRSERDAGRGGGGPVPRALGATSGATASPARSASPTGGLSRPSPTPRTSLPRRSLYLPSR